MRDARSTERSPLAPTPTPTAASTPDSCPAERELLVPTATPEIVLAINPPWRVSPSLEEQIFTSDVIVRASLLSATAGTETVPSAVCVAPTYRAVQELRFSTHEYLKGTGPTEVIVVVRGDHTYLTEAEAQQAAVASVSRRNTTWDGREGVLFLNTLQPPYAPTGASNSGASGAARGAPSEAFAFTLSNYLQSAWEYDIGTLSRAWLPARDAGGAEGRSSDAAAQAFITDGATSPPPVISLADLRSAIAEMAATLAAGEGIEGYEECIRRKISRERHRRAVPWTPSRYEATLASGSAAGTELYRDTNPYRDPKYDRYWLSGPDMGIFQASIIDDDSSPENGYDDTLTTARPLPAGGYRVFYNWQRYTEFPCNFAPDDAYLDWTVTVTAPAGTLHEAFFDPAAIGTVVGADGTNGALEPAGFTAGGTATTIQTLKWQGGVVTMELNPTASLSGHALDVIALDGSVALSLDGGAATASGGTLTWNVASQPWQAGDQLMLRIRETG